MRGLREDQCLWEIDEGMLGADSASRISEGLLLIILKAAKRRAQL